MRIDSQKSNYLFVFAFLVMIWPHAYAFKFSKKVCERYNLGPNWYCEKETSKALTTPGEIMTREISPEQKADLLKQLWEKQQKRAVITGKREDLESVLITQRYIVKLGADFAKNMVRLTEIVPEYSKSESYYQQISDEFIELAAKSQVLKDAKKRYAVAFVYSSNCPYCKRQLPILYSLKETYGITTLGVSADGGIYPGLDQVITDKEVIKDPNVQSFPTIMLVDSKTNKRLFIARGLTTKDRLETLIYKKILEVENE